MLSDQNGYKKGEIYKKLIPKEELRQLDGGEKGE